MNMNITVLLLLLVLCISIGGAAEVDQRTAAKVNRMKHLRRVLRQQMAKFRATFNEIKKNMENMPVMRGAKSVVLFEYTLPGGTTKCGHQVVTGWTGLVGLDVYYPAGSATASEENVFTSTTGEFKPPVVGWYHICAYFRFLNTGNSNDVTILKDGAVVAAFGNAITDDWLSTGTCILMWLWTTNIVTVKHQSGSSSDCIEETGWYYGRFSGFLIREDGEELEQMRNELNTSGHNDGSTSFDATLSGGTKKCGPQPITGWTPTLHDMNVFNKANGQFTPKTDGWYRICASFRFKQGGNANDVTLRLSGTRVAAFGNALQNDWRSTGTCVIVKMTTDNYMTLHQESGGDSDCIEETGWLYSRFTGHLIAPSNRSDVDTMNLGSAMFDATLGGYQTICGSQTVKGWIVNVDEAVYIDGSKGKEGSVNFDSSTGKYTVPIAGTYMICGYFRFRNTGNSNDVTLMKDGTTVVAAFGDAITSDWRSTGTCTVLQVHKGSQLSLKHQSGSSSDCIEETGWYYSRFLGYLIQAKD